MTGGAQSAFRPLVSHGCLPSFVPRPGALQVNICTQSSQDRAGISQATCMSSCQKRNAISSSYSSSQGLPGLKRRAPGPSNCKLPLGCSSSPGIPPKKAHTEKVAEGRVGQPLARKKCSCTGDASRPRKRKFPLLPHHRGEPLRLPPPLELACPVTAEDLDWEKEKVLQRINRLLMGETQAMCDSTTGAPQAHAWDPAALGGGTRPVASLGLSQNLLHHPSITTVAASTPMWVGSAVSSQRHPPTSNLSVLFPHSLPIVALALPPRPSPSTLAGLAPQPVAPFGATLMNTSLPSQSLHVGPPSSLGWSFLPSHQGPKPNRTPWASPVDSTSRPAPRVRQKALLGKQAVICGATFPQIPGVPHGKMPMSLSFASPQSGHLAAPGPGAAPIPPSTAGSPALARPKHSALGPDTLRNPPWVPMSAPRHILLAARLQGLLGHQMHRPLPLQLPPRGQGLWPEFVLATGSPSQPVTNKLHPLPG